MLDPAGRADDYLRIATGSQISDKDTQEPQKQHLQKIYLEHGRYTGMLNQRCCSQID